MHIFGLMIELEFFASRKDIQVLHVDEKSTEGNSSMATHSPVSTIRSKEYPDMRFTALGEFSVLTKNGTVHLMVTVVLPHKLLADVVVLVLGLSALFEECAFE